MSEPLLHRFNLLERVVHWVVGGTYVALLLTGLAFAYPALFWLTTPLGGGAAARVLHPYIGALFGIAMVLMVVLWLRDMFLSRQDIQWLGAVHHYATHQRDKVPPAGKYNAGQKLFFWVQGVLAVVFVASGVMLWFPEQLAPAAHPAVLRAAAALRREPRRRAVPRAARLPRHGRLPRHRPRHDRRHGHPPVGPATPPALARRADPPDGFLTVIPRGLLIARAATFQLAAAPRPRREAGRGPSARRRTARVLRAGARAAGAAVPAGGGGVVDRPRGGRRGRRPRPEPVCGP